MYAIIATLDRQTEKVIRGIWNELKELSLSDYAYEVKDREPHITLASFEVDDIDSVIKILYSRLNPVLPLKITFQSLGSFLGTNIVYLSPTKTPDVMNLHSRIHELFKEIIEPDSQYAPLNWIPHLTIANRIDEDKLAEIYRYCLNQISNQDAFIINLKLIEISDNSTKTIFDYSY